MYQKLENTVLLREESFGGTLFFVHNGHRAYVTRNEFDCINQTGFLLADIARELDEPIVPVKVIHPTLIQSNNFSAPDTVYLEVTQGCNLSCTHCFNNSGQTSSDQLTVSKQKEIIVDLAKSGVQEIRFTGGEPLTHKNIIELVDVASSLGLRCSMGSNATLINNRVAVALQIAGLMSCIVSLDGLKCFHDKIRGNGVFDSALAGIDSLRGSGIDVRVNVVVMRRNISEIVPLIKSITARGISVFLRRLILSGRAIDSSSDSLNREDYLRLSEELNTLSQTELMLVSGHYLREKSFVSRIPLPFLRKKCSAGQRGLVILSNGRVRACGFFSPVDEMNIGTMPTETLVTIWNRLSTSNHISNLERMLESYNENTHCPKTNCLAIALAKKYNL